MSDSNPHRSLDTRKKRKRLLKGMVIEGTSRDRFAAQNR
jgi:hypothetical protein